MTLATTDENHLRIFERRIIRKIYGPVFENGQWRILHNEEINQLISNEDIVRFIKALRIRWLGHIERMSEDRIVKSTFKSNPDGRRKRGRPKKRWKDDVIEDLHSMGVQDWHQITGNRQFWRNIVEKAKAHTGL